MMACTVACPDIVGVHLPLALPETKRNNAAAGVYLLRWFFAGRVDTSSQTRRALLFCEYTDTRKI